MQPLLDVRDAIWTWAAAPALALVAILLTVVLRAPQVMRLPDAFRAAFAHDAKAPGTLPPSAVVLLSTAATWGSAAAVSAATAISLGGAGAIAWIWLFGILIAPMRYAETLLARSSPPGKAGGDARGSLAARLSGDASAPIRTLGAILTVLVPVAAFTWFGGAHGTAALDAASRLLPGSEMPLTIGVAVLAGALAMVALGKAGPSAPAILGWLTLAAMLALVGVSLIALLQDASRGLGAFVRAIDDAFSGSESVGAFSGALAGEIAAAALLHLLPPLAATTGIDGSIQDTARAPTARAQAAASMLGPLFHVVLATVLGFSFVATGAFHRRVEDSRSLDELTFWSAGFDTASQRIEADRTFSGTLRVIDGSVLARPLELGTERGMVTSPRFLQNGAPGDFAMIVVDGHVTAMLVPDDHSTLQQVALGQLATVRVEGRMLPRGGALLGASMVRGGGDAASRIALTALLLLAAIGAAAWGLATSRAVPKQLALPAAFLPALGLLLAATGVAPWLSPVGAIVAGVLVTVAAIGILSKLRELRRLG